MTPSTVIGGRGRVTTPIRLKLHREVRTVDALNHAVTTAYDAVSRRAVRDRKGNVTTYEYDAVNRVTHQVDQAAGGGTTFTQTMSYDDDARVATTVDRRGIPTEQRSDGLGRVERVRRGQGALVQTTTTSYDGNGNPLRVTDPNGHVLAAEFDGANRRVAETKGYGSAEASRTTFIYDAAGNRVETKSARVTGVAYDTRETYDDLNRPVRSEDALGDVTTCAFDGAGNKVCEKRPLGNASGAAFGHGDAGGRSVTELVSSVCQGEGLTRYTYEEQSKLTSVTDAEGGTYTFVYDEVRNVVAMQDANQQLTTYAYDELQRRRGEYQHLDAHARLSTSHRSPVPLSEGVVDPALELGTLDWAYGYDANGNLTSTTDPKQQVTAAEYGVLDRLDRVEYQPSAAVELPALSVVMYVRDENGNVTEVTEEKETASGAIEEVTGRTYDRLDRLETETRYDGKVVRYEYELKGNRKKVTDPDQVATEYTYDAQDRLETVTLEGATTTYRYWPDSLLKGTVQPNGVDEGRCYDAAGRLVEQVTARGSVSEACSASGTALSSWLYGYDRDGNRVSQTEQRTDPATQLLRAAEETRYGYDALDRLTVVLYPAGKATLYQLDAVGNRIGEREYEGVTTASVDGLSFATPPSGTLVHDVVGTFNRADWLVSRTDGADAAASWTFSYDLAGNMREKRGASLTRQFAWDARNTLTAVYDNGAEVGRYDYDRDLQRVKRRTASENVEYVLDDRFVLQEADGSTSGHPSYRRYHYATQALAVTDAGQATRFISNDALGSLADLTTTGGTVGQARKYDAWGRYREGAPSANQPKLGYTGHQFDPETGLVYARARYYDPEIGVFLSLDALERGPEDAPNLHRFAWALMNPLRFFDPSGYAEEEAQPPPAPPPPQMVTEQDEAAACFSQDGTCPEEQAAQKRAQEAAERKGAEREAYFRARDAACVRNPELKMCHAEAVTTAEEDTEGPGTFKENDDPGVREATHRYDAGFAKVRAYAKTGQEVTEAAMTMLPGMGQLYDLKLTADEARNGNWRPALIRAGIVLAPGAMVAVAKVGGKWVARAVKAEELEGGALAGLETAAGRLQHEAYKDTLRAAMQKPHVVDAELAGLMDQLYRPGAVVGSGSTAAAVRAEAATGVAVGGKMHAEKARNYIKALERWLEKNPTARAGDRAAAENVIRDMANALEGK